ncbi:MAG: hypothetical protein ABSC06_37530 [Rhodopila sp.]|jgi:hypothetical protein
MPIIAVGIAIAVDAVAVSAAVAGTITALGVVAAVGATVAAVGTVTRDKALTIAGTVLGAVGAIGSLAAGAGVLGDSASAPLFGATPAASTADAASAGTIDSIAGGADVTPVDSGLIATPPEPPGDVGTVDPTTGNVITAPTSGAAAAPTAAAAGDTTTQASTAANAANPATAAVPTGSELAPQDAAAVQANTQAAAASGTSNAGLVTTTTDPTTPNVTTTSGLGTSVPATASTPGAVANPELGGATGFSPGGASQAIPQGTGFLGNLASNTLTGNDASSALGIANSDSSGAFDGLLAFANKNTAVTLGALAAGGSLISGLTSTLTPAQVTALNAQAAANDAAAALTKQQTANLAMPKAVASSTPVTGAPATLVPQAAVSTIAPGIINKPTATQVTGVPA